MQLLNDNFEANESFHQVYRDTIQETLKIIKAVNSKIVETILLQYYLIVCQNPYEEFKDINYDFNTFYEEYENSSLQEI